MARKKDRKRTDYGLSKRWGARVINKSQLHIWIDQCRWFQGSRLATLNIQILGEAEPKGIPGGIAFDVDLPLPPAVLVELGTFIGGIDWQTEVTEVLRQTDLQFTKPSRTDVGQYEVVWSPAAEAQGWVPGLATLLQSSWPAYAADVQQTFQPMAARTEEEVIARLEAGKTRRAVAIHLDISERVVSQIAKKRNKRKRKKT